MLYSAILTGITSVFVWNFQPFMKSVGVPVILFGYIYFINHMLRASGSILVKKITDKISLEKTGIIIYILYLISFIILFFSIQNNNIIVCISTIIFICIAIGFQMVFNVGSLARIHGLIPSISRATMSSVNSMLAGLFSGLSLMIFKFFVDYQSLKSAIIMFTILFIFSFIPIRKINKI